MKKYLICLSLSFPLFWGGLSASDPVTVPTDTRLVNEGKLVVASGGTIYVQGAQRMVDASTVNVDLQGQWTTEGDFYFDPSGKTGNVFALASAGTMRFVPLSNTAEGTGAGKRFVTTFPGNVDDFQRGSNYIAFPHLVIDVDTLELPARMGIDALSVKQGTDENFSTRHRKLLLKSKAYNGKAFDASLRITGKEAAEDDASANYVDAGAVIVERDISPYRPADSENSNAVYFAFATPFDSQYSAYFATNWVRKMLADGSTGHVAYPYGDKTGSDGNILREQYLYDYDQRLEAGQGYLLRLRPNGYDYDALHQSNGILLPYIGEDAEKFSKVFSTGKYTFNGTPPLSGLSENEQLFAKDILFSRSINVSPTGTNPTINWVIGNSYTAPISLPLLINELKNHLTLAFVANLYVLPGGSVSYVPISMNVNSFQLTDIDVIPAMSYFMIRLSKGKTQNGSLTLGKDLLVHDGETPHGLRAAKAYDNELVFRVSPAYQDNYYDLAGLGLRPGYSAASDGKDIAKMSAGTAEAFSLYTLSSDRAQLSVNMLPEETQEVEMGFAPGEVKDPFRLRTERMESLRTEGLWLEDLKTGAVTDLLQTGGEYVFESEPGDEPARFRLRFNRAATGLDNAAMAALGLYYSKGVLYLNGLGNEDLGSVLSVSDMSGNTCLLQTVTETTTQQFDLQHLPKGVYIARLHGNRTATLKLIK